MKPAFSRAQPMFCEDFFFYLLYIGFFTRFLTLTFLTLVCFSTNYNNDHRNIFYLLPCDISKALLMISKGGP